jgi:MFS family permease
VVRSEGVFASLANRGFRWLWSGSLASSFAMNMQIVARGWLIYDLTRSPVDLAWVTMSFTLPQVLFSLWGGVLADRMDKRRVIAVAHGMSVIATLWFATIVITDRVVFWDFITFGVWSGTILALSMPARQAYAPELVGEKLIFNAMALNTASWNLSRTLGPTLAGILIALVAHGDTSSTFGVGIVFYIIAALYAVSVLSVLMVNQPGVVRARHDGQSAISDIAEGLRYVRRHPPVFGLIALSLMPFLFGMPINTLLPAFNHDVLLGGPDGLGYLLGSMGAGAIVGSLMMARMGDLKRKGFWLVTTCVAWGALMGVFALATNLLAAAVVIGAIGWLSAWNMSLNRGLLSTIVSADMRGRIMSIDMMSHGLMPLGIVPISFVAEHAGVPAALTAAGVIFIVVVMALTLLPSVRGIDRAEEKRAVGITGETHA